MPDRYLVMFVLDDATDAAATELRQLAHHAAQLHPWTGPVPRFFDQVPDGSDERTIGVHLRVADEVAADDRRAVAALVHAVAAAAGRIGVRVEAQLGGAPVGVLSEGAIDISVAEALRGSLGVELG